MSCLTSKVTPKLSSNGHRSISVILTQVEVDAADPAFQKPTKPVGPFYAKYDEALAPMVKVGEQYRKVVASPLPKRIVELSTIEALVELGNVVICCGGGGVPVTLRDGELHGVPAVIDKDRTSALLARSLKVDALVMLTDVDGLYKNFGKPDQNLVSLLETSNLDNEWLGTLPPGSIGPKVASGIEFANATGGWAAIGSLNQLKNILEGTSGTRITNGNSNEAVSANFQEWNSATVQDWLRHDARLPEEHVEKLIATGNDSGASLASLDSEGLEKLGFPSRLSSFLLAEIKSAQEGSACPRVAASPYSWPHNRNISASNTAVVLVDFQESVFGGASSIVARAKEVVEAVRALKLPVIFTRGGYQPDLTECSNFQLWSNGGSVTVSGDALWNIIGDLSPDEGDKVLDHRPNSFHGELGTLLKSLGIQNAIIFGRTELCLRAQQEAQDSDIDALFVEDVSATTSVNLHRNSAKLASVYGAVTSVDFVLTGLASLK
jgi:nicotinamidase-related amidase